MSIILITTVEIIFSLLIGGLAFFTMKRYRDARDAVIQNSGGGDKGIERLEAATTLHLFVCFLVMFPVAVAVRRYIGNPKSIYTYIGPALIGTVILFAYRKLEDEIKGKELTIKRSVAVIVLGFMVALFGLTFYKEFNGKEFQDLFKDLLK